MFESTRARRGQIARLWHPDSPGSRVNVRIGWMRSLGLRRSAFATLGETKKYYEALSLVNEHRHPKDCLETLLDHFGIKWEEKDD